VWPDVAGPGEVAQVEATVIATNSICARACLVRAAASDAGSIITTAMPAPAAPRGCLRGTSNRILYLNLFFRA